MVACKANRWGARGVILGRWGTGYALGGVALIGPCADSVLEGCPGVSEPMRLPLSARTVVDSSGVRTDTWSLDESICPWSGCSDPKALDTGIARRRVGKSGFGNRSATSFSISQFFFPDAAF